MELKFSGARQNKTLICLLIEPNGIEISLSQQASKTKKSLLIEPSGIEINLFPSF